MVFNVYQSFNHRSDAEGCHVSAASPRSSNWPGKHWITGQLAVTFKLTYRPNLCTAWWHRNVGTCKLWSSGESKCNQFLTSWLIFVSLHRSQSRCLAQNKTTKTHQNLWNDMKWREMTWNRLKWLDVFGTKFWVPRRLEADGLKLTVCKQGHIL